MTNQLKKIQAQLIKNPKAHILNPLLGYLTCSSTPQNAFFLYNQMLHHPPAYNHYTFTYALKACSLLHEHLKGLEIHAFVVKSGYLSDIFIQNSLLHFYVVQKDVLSACQVFEAIPFPDVISWTSIISGLSKLGFEEAAIVKFLSMDVRPNSTTLVSILSACSSLRALKFGKAIHAYGFRNLIDENISLNNVLLDFYVRCGSLASARYLFARMPKRDVVSWTTMIGGYVHSGFYIEAVEVFRDMVQVGEVEPNEATLVNVLSACSSIGSLSLGEWVHSYVRMRLDRREGGNVGNALINMYVKCGSIGMAISVFNMLIPKDIISWSTIISGLAMNGHGKHAMQLFSLILVHGVPPDDVTFISLLSGCSHGGFIDQGLMFFRAMHKVYNFTPQIKHYACIVDMYGRAGLLIEAETFIMEMHVEDEGVVWGVLLNACRIHGNEMMFEQIRQRLLGSKGMSSGTFALLSNTYASYNRWNDANEVHDAMRSSGIKKMAGSSWIDVLHQETLLWN